MRKEREKDNRGGFRIGAGRKPSKKITNYIIELGSICVNVSDLENVTLNEVKVAAYNAALELINKSKPKTPNPDKSTLFSFNGIAYYIDMGCNLQQFFVLYEGFFIKAKHTDLLLFIKQVKALNLPIEIRSFVANNIRIWRK